MRYKDEVAWSISNTILTWQWKSRLHMSKSLIKKTHIFYHNKNNTNLWDFFIKMNLLKNKNIYFNYISIYLFIYIVILNKLIININIHAI